MNSKQTVKPEERLGRMSWNYRVMQDGYDGLTIREVFYSGGKVRLWTREQEPYGEDMDELRDCLKLMLGACDKPILMEKELEEKLWRQKGDE